MRSGEKIKDLLADYQPKHSEFQIIHFIVGKAGDNWAKYKQALREIKSRVEALQNLKEDQLLLENPKKEMFPAIRKSTKVFRRIAKDRRDRQLASVNLEIEHTERELETLIKIAEPLKRHFGEVDRFKRKSLEANSWFNKARQMAALDMYINRGQLSERSMEMILALPAKARAQIMVDLEKNDPIKFLER